MPAKSSYQGVLLGGKQCSEPTRLSHQSGPQHAVTPVVNSERSICSSPHPRPLIHPAHHNQLQAHLDLLVPGNKYSKAGGVKQCCTRGLRLGVTRGSMGRNLPFEKVILSRNAMKTLENFVIIVDFINKGS